MSDPYIIGSSIGRRSERTAFVVVRQVDGVGGMRYELGHTRRLPQDSSYVQVTQALKDLARALTERHAADEAAGPWKRVDTPAVHAVADVTGAGRPVFDLLAEEVDLTGLVISASTEEASGLERVPKRDLAATLDVLLQKRQLRFAEGLAEGPVLRKELQNFEARVNTGSEPGAFEEWREGAHDDLVFALGAACWLGENALPEDWSDAQGIY